MWNGVPSDGTKARISVTEMKTLMTSITAFTQRLNRIIKNFCNRNENSTNTLPFFFFEGTALLFIGVYFEISGVQTSQKGEGGNNWSGVVALPEGEGGGDWSGIALPEALESIGARAVQLPLFSHDMWVQPGLAIEMRWERLVKFGY
uniref:Uncharacterized protein n=1 Tax=Oryza brachyantha TaxID=4533 RepID=J3MMP6_ORYBR